MMMRECPQGSPNHESRMRNVLIRQAQKSDLEFVRQCAERAYEGYIDRIGQPPAPMVADFAESLNKQELEVICLEAPVGFVASYEQNGRLFVENIAIHPDHQNQGIASQVFLLLEDRCRQTGLTAIELYTNEKMTENLDFYSMLGFVETDRRRDSGFSRVYFKKTVAKS